MYQQDHNAESFENRENVEIHLRAIDLDRARTGWAAVLPSISDSRTKLQIDAIIDLEELKGKTIVTGDVTLVWVVKDDGKKSLSKVILREITSAQ
ncbi:MAG: hypothetical protein ACI9OU_001050 [Candidatus Promineifilaceae bacterium]